MSTSVDLYKYNFNKLINEFMTTKNITDKTTLEKILLEFGERIGDSYILLCNEYWEDYNSYYGLTRFIDKYFKVENSFDCLWSDNIECQDCTCSANIYDVADSLELKFPDEDEEEEN